MGTFFETVFRLLRMQYTLHIRHKDTEHHKQTMSKH